MKSPFNIKRASNRIYSPVWILIILFVIMILALAFKKLGVVAMGVVLIVPVVILFFDRLYKFPQLGLYAVLFVSFFAIGLGKYVKGIPFGLSVDALLVATYFILFFRDFSHKVNWKKASKDLTLLAAIWFAWILLQLFNPNQPVFQAWFFAMRGFGLYFFLIIPLVFLLFDKYKYINIFFYLWGILSILGTMKGAMQYFIGLDSVERAWLHGPGAKTHLLWGKIRYWSFYSDASIFGGGQAQAGVMGTILAITTQKGWKEKAFFTIVAFTGFFGMFISGTRGAIAVPLVGFFVYAILSKQTKIVFGGIIFAIGIYIFFAHTNIGQANYEIRRMRTAFKPSEDKSAVVRNENRVLLQHFMADKPFGTGVGSSGNWAIRFRPNSFLAKTPTDGWYTQIWVENGIIGLLLHVFILLYIMVKASFIIFFKLEHEEVKGRMMALVSSLAGVMIATYSGTLFGQMPVGIINYMAMGICLLALDYEKELLEKN